MADVYFTAIPCEPYTAHKIQGKPYFCHIFLNEFAWKIKDQRFNVFNKRRGGEWYPENRGSRKFLIRSRNLGDFCDESWSLVFHLFLSVSKSRIFFARSRSLRFASLAEILRQKLSRWASRVSVAEILAFTEAFHSPGAHAHLIQFPLTITMRTLRCWNRTNIYGFHIRS